MQAGKHLAVVTGERLMPEKSLRVLVAASDVSDLLLLRRLLRDTPYHVEAARTGYHALRALAERQYAAVLTDDERLPGMTGAKLLAEVERLQPRALRLLLVRDQRQEALLGAARAGRFRLFVRPFFAVHVRAALVDHLPKPARPDTPVPIDAKTAPHELDAGGAVARRRMLLAMAELVEAKAGHSSGHGTRVSALASQLGRALGMKSADLDTLEEAALLHDVGELAVDSVLLQRRRRLTPSEQREVRCHVESGLKVAQRGGFHRVVLTAVRHHHERWDGQGYPDGLAGANIPLEARIIAVADIWDALATDRPYRTAMSVNDCMRTLKLLAGSHLDPAMVDLFLSQKLFLVIDWAHPPRAAANLLGA